MKLHTSKRGCWQAAVLAVALVVFTMQPRQALSETVELTPAQMTLLELQLKDSYKCKLAKILFSREIEVGGKVQLDGRVQCVDEREVDFTQSGPNEKFELRLCQPTVC